MENKSSHLVFIGGSGMLLNLVRKKLDEGCKVALLCRNPPALKGNYHPIPCNYNDPESFPALLEKHFQVQGNAGHIICWMRTGSVYPFLAMCEMMILAYPLTRLWHLRGSSWYDNPDSLPFQVPDEILSKIKLHKIYLGSVESAETKRWLHDEEICSGVEQALSSEKEIFCVGNYPPFDSLF